MSWSVTLIKTNGFTASGSTLPVASLNAGAGALVCACWSVKGANTITGFSASDTGGNSWTVHAVQQGSGTGEWAVVCWAVLGAVWTGATLTLARNGSGNISSYAYYIAILSGGGTAEDTAVLHSNTGSGTSPTNTGNTANWQNALNLALTAVFPAATSTYSEDSSWTNLVSEKTAGSADAALSVSWRVNAGTAGLSHAPTLGTSSAWAEMMIAFDATSVQLAGDGTIAIAGTTAPGYSASLLARTSVAVSGTAAANWLARIAGRLAAAMKGFAGIAPAKASFDPQFALLASPRTLALAAPAKTLSILSPARAFALLTD